jgi:hypothetical protein
MALNNELGFNDLFPGMAPNKELGFIPPNRLEAKALKRELGFILPNRLEAKGLKREFGFKAKSS